MSERAEFPPGIHRGISYDEYAAWPGLRKSSLWPLVTKTPAHFRHRMDNPEEPTPAMKFGTAFHTKVLEPERFQREYAIGGPINPKTDKPYGPDTKKTLEWVKAQGVDEVLSFEDADHLDRMRDAVLAHEEASAILAKAECEVSMLWEDEATGRFLQGRDDVWIENVVLFGDVKTASSAHPQAFARDSMKYGYLMQAAMYWDGASALTGQVPYKPQFIVVEKTPPYAVAIYEIEIPDLELGRQQYRLALARLEDCEKEDTWPAYPGVQRLEIPEWAQNKVQLCVD